MKLWLLEFQTAVVSVLSSVSTFHPEEGHNKFLRNIIADLKDRFALHSRRQTFLNPEPRESELYI
jgi:hypothetical protein